MKLNTFSVTNYRSIRDEVKLDHLRKFNSIVGPNNTGKSNLLRALMIGFSIATEGVYKSTKSKFMYNYEYHGEDFIWSRDIPRELLNNEEAKTSLKLTFEFDDKEKAEFKEKLGINLSKSLRMQFNLYREKVEYSIIMPGRAKKPMEEKMDKIGLFIKERLFFQFIPCVRTSEFTADYFVRLLNNEMELLTDNPDYIECMARIKELQEPIISGLEDKLTKALQTFLPNINSVTIGELYKDTSVGVGRNIRGLRYLDTPIYIDDGCNTSIEHKGDGIKSLAAIGLVQSISFQKSENRALILCIEEPEAHLHPDAIHSLRNILLELSSRANTQVIITTHSPLLVDRDHVKANFILNNNHQTEECNSLAQIKEILGVRYTDNLAGAQKVVLVEGEIDKRIITKLLAESSENISEKIQKSEICILPVHSASKMDYQIKLFDSLLIPTIVVLDSDDSGQDMERKLIQNKIKLENEVLMIKSRGMREAEIEDLIDCKQYEFIFKQELGIDLSSETFCRRRKSWSKRFKTTVEYSPVSYSTNIESRAKEQIADIVDEFGFSAINDYDKEYVASLIAMLTLFVLR